jgi:5-(carboxyamino)imidazole ribonucleotide synthase
MTILPGPATIGILGGGQLGRMLALAAAPLGYRVHVLRPRPNWSRPTSAACCTRAAYEDRKALAAFAASVRRDHLRVRECALGCGCLSGEA